MANRCNKTAAPPNKPATELLSIAASAAVTRHSRKKLLLFRLIAVAVVPIVIASLLEIGLRIAGCGYPTAFLLASSRAGQEGFVQNNQFGWRFFGPRLARLPEPVFISRRKRSETVRIFVFGESAAKGEPQPAFGVPRMLQTMLQLRHPGARFEVVNAAMTAINSHAVLPIARDCANAGGDIWVVYMGNNEVVGPFGAGTVFGPQSLPLPLIRATLALKTTRIGQLLESGFAMLPRAPTEPDEWRGMEMFLHQQVRRDDPRMAAVYEHFERNLADILRAGQRSGAGIVVSTVAVNLRDCAPFASAHHVSLSSTDTAKWSQLYQLGIEAQDAGNYLEAAQRFEEAARIDADFAELRFRQGSCELEAGKAREALRHFQAARDLDTLRFRCDSRLNELTRQTAAKRESERILLADSERAFAEQSPEGMPSGELFYDHVHPTFQGNYVLAKALGEQIEKLLPEGLLARGAAPRSWPSEADCAQSLGWTDWSRLAALQAILARLNAPPFTGQVNHDAQLRALTAAMQQLSPALQAAGVAKARNACEAALAEAPDDPVLLGQLAYFKQSAGDLDGAAALTRRELELMPNDSQGWLRSGLVLVGQLKLDQACAAFRRAMESDPSDVLSMQNLGQSLWLLGRRDEAIAKYRRAVKLQPNFTVGWLSLGQALEEAKLKAEAEECFQKAMACWTSRATDLVTLARFCRSRGWQEAAATNYDEAINVSPGDAKLRIEAGENLLTLGRSADAARNFAEAVRLAPDSARAHQLYGSALGQQGMAAGAEDQFRETLRLSPDLVEARLNLGIALMSQRRNAEALSWFEDVLKRSPTNELALRYSRELQNNPALSPER